MDSFDTTTTAGEKTQSHAVQSLNEFSVKPIASEVTRADKLVDNKLMPLRSD
jgi:hypothetical protein